MIYNLQSEICESDKHIFNTGLETMLQFKQNKKRRFLLWAEYLINASY